MVARAQQPSRPTIGLLSGASPEDSVSDLSAFARGLTEAGYVEGKNFAIEYRWARGEYNVLSPMAADLVGRQVSVIATFGTNAALAAKAATTTIPIVFVNGGDPIASGLVDSLSRPGGNITGVNLLAPALNAKRLELLNETVPQARVVAMLVNPRARNAEPNVDASKTAAGSLGKQLVVLNASTDDEIAAAFADLSRQQVNALIVGTDIFLNSRSGTIVTLASKYAVPGRGCLWAKAGSRL